MQVFSGHQIRNVAVVGHGASGKTTLVDAMAFVSGASKRRGSVTEGTALTDYTPEEIKRKYSTSLALAHAVWVDTKINLIDTPGYLDFTGEALAAIYAADAAVVVLSATSGVEAGTEKVWEYAQQRGIPCLFFVSLMDKEHADLEKVLGQIGEDLTKRIVPIELPVGEGPDFQAVIDLFSKKCHKYKTGTKAGEYDEVDIPADYQERFKTSSQNLLERIAETDDALLERFFDGKGITSEELLSALKSAMRRGELFPVLCGSGALTYGTRSLLTKIVELVPAPTELEPFEAQAWGTAEKLSIEPTDDGQLVAQVFKTVSEPHVGDVTLFRLLSGTISNGSEVYNGPREGSEKLNHLSVAQGKDRTEVPELHVGDIGVVAKLRDTHTNDTLSTQEKPVVVGKIPFPEPLIAMAVEVKERGEEDKLSTGLHKLHEEDPTFQHDYSAEVGQTLIRGRGERHLEIVMSRLKRKFGVSATLAKPRIAYRETFKGKAEGQGKHKKQTGGRGQFGECWIRIIPVPRGSGYEFESKIAGGVIPTRFIPAVEKGVKEAAARGVLAGFPVVDFKVECYDGKYHNVDSNEVSFKMAGILAFRNVSPNCRPVLLEPILDVEVWTPEENLGEVMGDLSGRRGHILGSEPDGRRTRVHANVPEAEMYKYTTQLNSITHGRGTFSFQFSRYEQVPPEVAQKIIEEHKQELESAQ